MKVVMQIDTETPWGPVMDVTQIAPGIWHVDTGRHGGVALSPRRWMEMRRFLPRFIPWVGLTSRDWDESDDTTPVGWLERDQDAAVVPLVWPEHFDGHAKWAAVRTVRSNTSYYSIPKTWWVKGKLAPIATEAAEYARTIAHLWEQGGAEISKRGTFCGFYRIGDRFYRWLKVREYPRKALLTDEDLEALIERGPTLEE